MASDYHSMGQPHPVLLECEHRHVLPVRETWHGAFSSVAWSIQDHQDYALGTWRPSFLRTQHLVPRLSSALPPIIRRIVQKEGVGVENLWGLCPT